MLELEADCGIPSHSLLSQKHIILTLEATLKHFSLTGESKAAV